MVLGATVRQLDSLRHSPVTVLACVPAPSSHLMAATTDAIVRVLDLRALEYAHQYKVGPLRTTMSTWRGPRVRPSLHDGALEYDHQYMVGP